jgi:oxygen-independent coproporphyrinogen-3 oxidase
LVRDLYALGVNRFSIGVQSFVDKELAALGRIHDGAAARAAIAAARSRCTNVSIDLMCGIPLQTPASWENTLAVALASGVTHVSIYPLNIEEDTPFARAVASGALDLPNEDEQAQMMECAAKLLQEAGFERYEVASYAKPGFTCEHNIAYWTGKPYLGLGEGAAGMRMVDREVKREDGAYPKPPVRERLLNGAVVETLTPAQVAAEDLMLGMRMARGVSAAQVAKAGDLLPGCAATFSALIDLGLVELRITVEQEYRYQPTAKGWLLGNELYGRIWALAD